MDTIVLYNQNGQKFDVDVIRYFKVSGKKYLIFSMDEIDGNGYIQLYVSRIEEFAGKYNMLNITDDAEWAAFKEAIHGIVNNNRANIPNNNDLDFNPLDGTVINQFRIFKLKKDVAEVLSQNKNPQVSSTQASIPVMPTEPIVPAVEKVENAVNLETASAQDTGMTLEQIIKRVSDTAKEAREEKVEAPKKTIEDLLKSTSDDVPDINTFFNDEEVKPKYIPPQVTPVTDDYKAKYEEAMENVHRLEEENMRLINELVEAKAKIETIKDIIA
jgi:hypothetical protein